MSRGRPKEREDIVRTKYTLDYGDVIYHFDAKKNPNGFWRVDIIDPIYDKLEKLYEKLERLKKPKYHENGRKKRTTKLNKQKMESAEKTYWKEHYKLYPEDKPKKRGRRKPSKFD